MRQHGTRVRYAVDGCRCVDCSIAAGDYEKQRRRLREAGIPAYVDAAEAREHLEFLRSHNVGRRTVAREAGLAESTVAKIAGGKVRRARQDTVDKILAVGLHRGSAKTWVDAGPTWALIDDMLANGITKSAISAGIGQCGRALQLRRTRIEKRNAEAVRRFYDEVMAPVVARREWAAEERAKYRQLERERAAS